MNKSDKKGLDKVSLDDRAKARRAYFQGGPGVNDPKELGYPGEIKYPRMEVPVGGDSREWEQAWFEGAAEQTKQKMGPQGVELELKKKLQRAKLSARFVKNANRKDSFWEFSQNKKPFLRASVDDIFGRDGQDIDDETWNWVSSKDYAKYAMNEMRARGLEAVAYALTGKAMTREGTVAMIKREASHKAYKAYLIARRVHRNWLVAEGKLKEALAADYSELQKILAEMKLVDKNASLPALKQASTESRHALYKMADEAFLDADEAMGDAEQNADTAEATSDAAAPAAPAPVDAGSKPADEPMPGGGMAYNDGEDKYPAPDERQVAQMHPVLPHSHGELPFQQLEQLELKDLAEGPSGKQRAFDKAESSVENLVSNDGIPTGDVNQFQESSGGGISHTEESPDAPGLNSETPQWGFAGRPKDFTHLPHGGLDQAAPAGAEVPAEESEEVEEDAEESTEEAEETEEAPEEAEESDDEVEEDAEEDEDEEPKEAEASDRRSNRKKILQAALEQSAAGNSDFAKLYSAPGFKEYYGGNKDFANYYGLDGAASGATASSRADAAQKYPDQPKDRATAYNEQTGGAAPAAPAEPAANADAAIAASFNAKSSEALKKETQVRMQRAYDMAADMQSKGWIGPSKEDLHKQASLFGQMDDKTFELFKTTCSNLKSIKASESKKDKVNRIAGPQRPVIKSPSSDDSDDADLEAALKNLDWK